MDHVVALHGFAGTGRTWDAVAAAFAARGGSLSAPDLPGHGAAAEADAIDLDGWVAATLAEAPERFTLCGYSMGGRVALRLALAAPERVARLVLVAATAGIDDVADRAARRKADLRQAAEIAVAPIELVAERWTSQPLFAGDPPLARERQHEDVLRNDPAALAAALRVLGQGASEPVWDRLGELTMPAAVVAGARDGRYVAIGERLVATLPSAAPLVVVAGCGHGVPREAPEALAGVVAGAG